MRFHRQPNDPTDFKTKLEKATDLIATITYRMGRDWREDVAGAIKTALEMDNDVAWVNQDETLGEVVSLPGIFRLIFNHGGIDRHDLVVQETIYAIVRTRLEGIVGFAADRPLFREGRSD